MRIGVVYLHCSRNIGDLAINSGTVSLVQSVVPEVDVHFVTLNPKPSVLDIATAELPRSRSISVSALRTRHTQARVSKTEFRRAAKYISRPGCYLHDTALNDCEIILYNSGDHLFTRPQARAVDLDDVNLFWRALPALAAQHAKSRFITLPVTVGPLEEPSVTAPILRALAGLSDDFAVRDSMSIPSATHLLKGRVPRALLDPAFFVSTPGFAYTTDPPTEDQPVLGMVMRLEGVGLRVGRSASRSALAYYAKEAFKCSRSFQFAVTAARSWLEELDGQVQLLVQSPSADRALTHAIAHTLDDQGFGNRVRVIEVCSVSDYMAALRKTSFVVSSRLHSLVLGLVCERPVMGVHLPECGHKMPGLFAMLGLTANCLCLSEASVEAVARCVVPLFRERHKAFKDMSRRLELMRGETVDWLKHAFVHQPQSDRITAEELEHWSECYRSGLARIRAGYQAYDSSTPRSLALARSAVRHYRSWLTSLRPGPRRRSR